MTDYLATTEIEDVDNLEDYLEKLEHVPDIIKNSSAVKHAAAIAKAQTEMGDSDTILVRIALSIALQEVISPLDKALKAAADDAMFGREASDMMMQLSQCVKGWEFGYPDKSVLFVGMKIKDSCFTLSTSLGYWEPQATH